jgi:hypothetical protein
MHGAPGASRRSNRRPNRPRGATFVSGWPQPLKCDPAKKWPVCRGGLPIISFLSFTYKDRWRGVTVRTPMAGVLQQSNLDVYLNGAKQIANGNFVRVRGEESGILNDDAENNSFCGTPGVGRNFAGGHPP